AQTMGLSVDELKAKMGINFNPAFYNGSQLQTANQSTDKRFANGRASAVNNSPSPIINASRCPKCGSELDEDEIEDGECDSCGATLNASPTLPQPRHLASGQYRPHIAKPQGVHDSAKDGHSSSQPNPGDAPAHLREDEDSSSSADGRNLADISHVSP